ncbi:MAG: ClbS/DfsB family four-helix bundle protein [Candidatus Jorgensenbacteria bacterium]
MGNSVGVITFFKNLKESDWKIPVTKKWRVKDVLSHLIGWERECARELEKVFETGNEPWFMLTDDYDEFNERIYREFKNYSSEALISELEKWQEILESNIQKIGEDKIRQRPHMDWVFDEGGKPHFEHHLNQIKKVLGI